MLNKESTLEVLARVLAESGSQPAIAATQYDELKAEDARQAANKREIEKASGLRRCKDLGALAAKRAVGLMQLASGQMTKAGAQGMRQKVQRSSVEHRQLLNLLREAIEACTDEAVAKARVHYVYSVKDASETALSKLKSAPPFITAYWQLKGTLDTLDSLAKQEAEQMFAKAA